MRGAEITTKRYPPELPGWILELHIAMSFVREHSWNGLWHVLSDPFEGWAAVI